MALKMDSMFETTGDQQVTMVVGNKEGGEEAKPVEGRKTALLSTVAAKRILEQRKDAQEKRKLQAEAMEKEKGLRWSTLTTPTKEAITYFIFLCVFCAATFGPRSLFAYHLHQTLENLLYAPSYAYRETFYTIGNSDDLYNWMTVVFLPNWVPPTNYSQIDIPDNNYNLTLANESSDRSNSTCMLRDQVNLRVGRARIRTQRAADLEDCFVPSIFKNLIPHCYGDLAGGLNKSVHRGVPFRTKDELDMPAFTSVETQLTYEGDGYAADLPNDYDEALALINAVFLDLNFMDDSTRVVMLDFSIYSPFIDYFSVQTAVVELLPANLAVVTATDRVAPLLRPLRVFSGDANLYQTTMMAMELILYGMVVMYICRELAQWRELGTWKYFDSGWNCIEMFNFMFFFITIVLRLTVIGETYRIQDSLTDREHFNNLVSIATLSVHVDSVNSINAVLCFLKFFKYLNVNKKLAQFNDTIVLAYKDMLVLCVIIAVVLVGYALAFVLCFGSVLYNYRTCTVALLTLFQALLGTFDFEEIQTASPVVGVLLFLTFVFLMMFIIMSMFLATVDKSYETVREEILTNKDTDNDEFSYDLMRIRRAFLRQTNKVLAFFDDDEKSKGREGKNVVDRDHSEGEGKGEAEGATSERVEDDPAYQSMGNVGYHELVSRIYRLEMSQIELRQILVAAERGLTMKLREEDTHEKVANIQGGGRGGGGEGGGGKEEKVGGHADGTSSIMDNEAGGGFAQLVCGSTKTSRGDDNCVRNVGLTGLLPNTQILPQDNQPAQEEYRSSHPMMSAVEISTATAPPSPSVGAGDGGGRGGEAGTSLQ